MNKQIDYAAAAAHALVLAIVSISSVGWGLNLAHIFNGDLDQITCMLVLRIIGVFIPPIGVVLGFV